MSKAQNKSRKEPTIPKVKKAFDDYVKKEMAYANPIMETKPSIQTGCDNLDLILPGGGIPRGVVTEIFGPESVGKTTLVIQAMINAKALFLKEQKKTKAKEPKRILFMDYEHIMDAYYAGTLGVEFYDPKTGKGDPMYRLLQPLTIEEGHNLLKIYAGEFGLVIVDSVAAMQCQKQRDEGADFKQIGLLSQKITSFFTDITKELRTHGMTLVCINQCRVKSDGMGGFKEGSYGGWAYKHYLALRIELNPGMTVRSKVYDPVTKERVDRPVCNVVHAEITKNKRGIKGAKVDYHLRYGMGFDNYTPMIELAKKKKVVEIGGGGYLSLKDGDKTLLQGRGMEDFIAKLQADKSSSDYLYKKMPFYEDISKIRAGLVVPPSLLDLINEREHAAKKAAKN